MSHKTIDDVVRESRVKGYEASVKEQMQLWTEGKISQEEFNRRRVALQEAHLEWASASERRGWRATGEEKAEAEAAIRAGKARESQLKAEQLLKQFSEGRITPRLLTKGMERIEKEHLHWYRSRDDPFKRSYKGIDLVTGYEFVETPQGIPRGSSLVGLGAGVPSQKYTTYSLEEAVSRGFITEREAQERREAGYTEAQIKWERDPQTHRMRESAFGTWFGGVLEMAGGSPVFYDPDLKGYFWFVGKQQTSSPIDFKEIQLPSETEFIPDILDAGIPTLDSKALGIQKAGDISHKILDLTGSESYVEQKVDEIITELRDFSVLEGAKAQELMGEGKPFQAFPHAVVGGVSRYLGGGVLGVLAPLADPGETLENMIKGVGELGGIITAASEEKHPESKFIEDVLDREISTTTKETLKIQKGIEMGREQARIEASMKSLLIAEMTSKAVKDDPMILVEWGGAITAGILAGKIAGKVAQKLGLGKTKITRIEELDADVWNTKTWWDIETSSKKFPSKYVIPGELDDLKYADDIAVILEGDDVSTIGKLKGPEGFVDDLLEKAKGRKRGMLVTEGVPDFEAQMIGSSDEIGFIGKELSPEIDISVPGKRTAVLDKRLLEKADDLSFMDDELASLTPENVMADIGEGLTFIETPEELVTFGGPYHREGTVKGLLSGEYKFDVKGGFGEIDQLMDDLDEIKAIEPSGAPGTPWRFTHQQPGFTEPTGKLETALKTDIDIAKELTQGLEPVIKVSAEPSDSAKALGLMGAAAGVKGTVPRTLQGHKMTSYDQGTAISPADILAQFKGIKSRIIEERRSVISQVDQPSLEDLMIQLDTAQHLKLGDLGKIMESTDTIKDLTVHHPDMKLDVPPLTTQINLPGLTEIQRVTMKPDQAFINIQKMGPLQDVGLVPDVPAFPTIHVSELKTPPYQPPGPPLPFPKMKDLGLDLLDWDIGYGLKISDVWEPEEVLTGKRKKKGKGKQPRKRR